MSNDSLVDVISTYLYMMYNEGKRGVEWSESSAEDHAQVIIDCVNQSKQKPYRWRATD